MFTNRFSSSCGVVGVDIGSRTIRLLQLRSGSGGLLEVVGAAEVPSRDLTGDQLAHHLKAAFTTGGFTGRRCVVSMPRSDLHVQAVRLPKMSDAELKEAAKWEAVERFGLDPKACEVDIVRLWAAGGRNGSGGGADTPDSREEVLIVAAAHAVLNARLSPVLAAGLRPIAVDTHFGALARMYSRRHRREADRHVVRAVLEVGSTGSTVIILRGDHIAFCKLIDIGGVHFNQHVAEHLQMDVAEAAELRANRGQGSAVSSQPSEVSGQKSGVGNEGLTSDLRPLTSGTDPSTDRAIYEAVRPLMGELAKEVMLCLRYYGVTFRGKPAEGVILTGGECTEPHLDEMIAGACKLPVQDDPELAALAGQIRDILRRSPGPATAWAVAAGLSMREMKEHREAAEHVSGVRGQKSAVSGQRSEAPPQTAYGAGVKSQKSDVGHEALTSGKEAA